MPKLKIRRYRESDNKDVWKLHILGLEQFQAYLGGKWDKDLDNIKDVYLKNGDFMIGEMNNKIIAMEAIKKNKKKKSRDKNGKGPSRLSKKRLWANYIERA